MHGFSGRGEIKVLITIILLLVSCNAYAENEKAARMESNETQTYDTFESLMYLYQPYLSNISPYEAIYFLVGTKPEKSKFQFSFKYRLIDKDGPLADSKSWLTGLHFGYTQTSYWNLKEDSLPFEDTSYKPELFHLSRNVGARPAWMQGFFMQAGFKHESNGQAEPLSRSTNSFYLRPIFIFYNKDLNKSGLAVSPSAHIYFDNSESNPDFPDYRGNVQIDVVFGKADAAILASNWRWAKEGGSVQLDLSYPASHYLSDNINVYLHFQYVNALAEGMLQYQDRTEAFRMGISFTR